MYCSSAGTLWAMDLFKAVEEWIAANPDAAVPQTIRDAVNATKSSSGRPSGAESSDPSTSGDHDSSSKSSFPMPTDESDCEFYNHFSF